MWCVRKYLGVVWIGVACNRPRRLGPAETEKADHKKDRECSGNEDADQKMAGLNELKHGTPLRKTT
jgi:hypothetical protein